MSVSNKTKKVTSLCLFAVLIVLASTVAVGIKGYSRTKTVDIASFPEVELKANDRILILAPHPDDEVLGCGGIIQKALKMHLPIHIAFLTYGDSNQWAFMIYRKHPVFFPKSVRAMGLIRHDEAIDAAQSLGVQKENLTFLGYPDFKTLNIWESHWGKALPAKGLLTEARAVPYKNAFRPGAPYKGEEILKDLKTVLLDFKPTKIFVSHPGDFHPDHQALYLFTRVALWDLKNKIKPSIYTYLIHYKLWPRPLGPAPEHLLIPPQIFDKIIPWQISKMNATEIKTKLAAIKKHKTEFSSDSKYLLSFIRQNELFGDFPTLDLAQGKESTPLVPYTGKENEPGELEQLNENEHVPIVGIEKKSAALDNDTLELFVKLSRPIGKGVGVSVYVFGYKKDKSFAEMPKYRIQFDAIKHKIFNKGRRIAGKDIIVVRTLKEIKIRIPLSTLDDPERILTDVNTYMGAVPLDWVSWRIIKPVKQ
ncbi:MAG: hypothetical protein COS99_07795 [Candidatus Omnitrophica bacterium CG07_land_8_20_14_0_80_42_15]|uniref:PIG-L family deacetylase n=1 Tax=Candidatus Aquitaenariimonas noxiae TaxID=1974741 RepID=A0A2J0KT63_9BACT|nr:MAG: hypothetical protein COS99_07795 [Candidatus Omnitrophica bacterium CG07_land_8_20_14_0_80_42_15]